MRLIRIGTRKSRLAMIQTGMVKEAIERVCPQTVVELVPMSTLGDRILDRSLTSFGGKGVFTQELESALLDGSIDMAVHSAKDMPMEFPDGLGLGAVLERANPADVLVTVHGTAARELPAGSVIGTSSLRREIQLRKMNPGITVKMLRGNVPTRLDKLAAGEYDGIILAAAGIERLGLHHDERFYFEYLDTNEFIPAAGQGILATEIRCGELQDVIEKFHSEQAAMMLEAEREYLRILGGGCNAPCGAYAYFEGDNMVMKTMYALDGKNPQYYSYAIKRGEPAEKLSMLSAAAVRTAGPGFVSLVGAGPGDRGLITEKGLNCIVRADVIVYDALIPISLLNDAKLDAELIYAGKRSSNHQMKQEEINQLLVDKAMEGNYVVRLKGGDPYIFGRGGEEAFELKKAGISFEIVPGVSSSYSVPAYAGIPVTQRNMASSFHVITGHESNHKDTPVLDYETLAKEDGTLIFLMGLHNLAYITEKLIQCGKNPDTPAAVIQKGTTSKQRKAVGTLGNIVHTVKKNEIQTPAIAVVGDVVSCSEELEWYGNLPLSGKKVLLTGTRQMVEKLEKALEQLGAEIAAVSLIETISCQGEDKKNLEEQLGKLNHYQWVVFTSQNGVELFFAEIRKLKIDNRQLSHLKFAAIGSGSKAALEEYGFLCDFVPSRYSSEDMAKEWIPTLKKEDRVLLCRAKEGSPVLPKQLKTAGVDYLDLPLYETWTDVRRAEDLNRVVGEMDYITIASGSAVRALASMLESPSMIQGKLISIGPETTKAAEKAGMQVDYTASDYTADGIVQCIWNDLLF